MAFKSLEKYYASDAADALGEFKDLLVSAGWTLHDTITDGFVMKSLGEDGDEFPCYLYMYVVTDEIEWRIYADWNNVSHTGTFYTGHTTYSHVDADADGPFYVWGSADKSSCVLVAFFAGKYNCLWVGLVDPFSDVEGILDSGVSSGSDVVLSLGTGEADGFIENREYQIIDGTSRQWVMVNDVDTGADELTITTLSYDFSAGARIGTSPHRWVMFVSAYQYGYMFRHNQNGTGNDSSYCPLNALWVSNQYMNPDERNHQHYVLWPILHYDVTNEAVKGFARAGMVFLKAYIAAVSEQTMSVGDIDDGTSSGSNTTTTLNDTSKSWTTDVHATKLLIITGGTGAGQFRRIASNDADTLTISVAFSVTPDATSTYTICEEGWEYFYFNSNAAYAGAIKMG